MLLQLSSLPTWPPLWCQADSLFWFGLKETKRVLLIPFTPPLCGGTLRRESSTLLFNVAVARREGAGTWTYDAQT